MAKPKRVNAFLATLNLEKQPVPRQAEEVKPQPAQPVREPIRPEPEPHKPMPASVTPKPAKVMRPAPPVVAEKKPAPAKTKPKRLKQVNLAIGEEREVKLDDLAYQYSRKKKRRVNRCDIVRYLIDTLTLEELLTADLSQHEK